MERDLVDGSCNQSVEDKAEFLVSFQLATVITGHMQTVPFSVTSRFCRIGCSLHFKVPPVRIPAEKQLLEHTLQNVNSQQRRQSTDGPTTCTGAVCSRARGTGWGAGGALGTPKGDPSIHGGLEQAEFSASVHSTVA